MTSAGLPPSSPEHWQRVKELLNAALELQPGERDAYLTACCAGDASLRSELNSLLSSFAEAGDFLDNSPAPPGEQGSDPVLGMRIGPYKVLEEIGRGGMGTVYRAVRADDVFRKQAAIKLVRRGMDHDFVLKRFRTERQILATLEHPNIARLLDGGATEDGLPYFVMEFIGGKPIDRYCDDRKLDTRDRLRLFQQVCAAVQAAHDRKIVHRDIKPGNILVGADGQPKLLDFGIAKIFDPEVATQTIDPTATVLRLMTPEYASPEQVLGEPVTASTDIYSLGVLLYELLTGHRPYRIKSRSPHEIAQVICEGQPERPSTVVCRTEVVTRGESPAITLTPELVSDARQTRPSELRRALAGDIDNIILMAMRKDPARRYPSAAALSEDIERYLAGRTVKARKDTLLYRARKGLRRNPVIAVLGAIAAAAAGGLLFMGIRSYQGASGVSAPPRIVPLTSFPGDETQPAFSPDGERVAFVWVGDSGDNPDIYVKTIKSGDLNRITSDSAEDISPTWSPDGRRIAFLRASDKETAVFVAALDRSRLHGKIVDVYPERIEAVGKNLDWSPDGKYLAVSDKYRSDEPFRIVLIDVTTGAKTPITTPEAGTIGDSNPAFAPDGQSIAFIRNVSSGVDDVYTVAAAGGPVKRITLDRRYIISLTWDADGRGLFFSSNRGGSHSLWRATADGGEPQRVPAMGENASDPVFSLASGRMAYTQFYMDTNIWRTEVSGGPAKKLIASTQQDSSPQYSPDGRYIAFRSTRSGYNEIWIANADGTNPQQLTTFSNTLTGTPRWSPDGKRIACDSRPEGQPDIFIIDVASKAARRLTSDPGEDVVPSWSGDGKWIYFASVRTGTWQVWKAQADGTAAEQVTSDGGFAAFESPDGRFLYFAKGRSVPGLWRKPTSGGAEERVLDRLKPGYWGYWGVCGPNIYFADRSSAGPAKIYGYDPNSRSIAEISSFEKPPILADSAFAVSPNCRQIAYSQIDQSGSDIMLVENYSGAP